MSYTYQTLDDASDPTFNQLLSINNAGTLAGYSGIGLISQPNSGYRVVQPYGQTNYVNENFPGATQTQVTGINDSGRTVGFWMDPAGDSIGFVDENGTFVTALDPLAPALGNGSLVTEQFLGVNDVGQVAGFYLDSSGFSHAFVYSPGSGKFTAINVSGATSVTATDINNRGQVSGFFTAGGVTDGFVETNGTVTVLAGPAGATDVQALGLNDDGLVVGSYVDGSGNTDGFVYNSATGTYTTIIDPNADGVTVVNGINDLGQLAGYYADASGDFHGMLVTPPPTPLSWTFQTLNNAADPTFNQLLSINDSGTIAGYDGSGAAGHPNKGYVLAAPYGQANYTNENFPTSAQTQVTAISADGATAGFWVDGAGDNVGFVDINGAFTVVLDPAEPAFGGSMPITEQLLGLNDIGQAVGFYDDTSGNAHGFIYNIGANHFQAINIAGASSVTATGINDEGQVSGYYTAAGATDGFIDSNGIVTTLTGPAGATDVHALGLNNIGMVVGSYVDGSGNTDGFVYNMVTGNYATIVDPNAGGKTVVNGVNDLGQLAGSYQDSSGHTDGFLATLTTQLGTGALV